jgi:hypothetical protein
MIDACINQPTDVIAEHASGTAFFHDPFLCLQREARKMRYEAKKRGVELRKQGIRPGQAEEEAVAKYAS